MFTVVVALPVHPVCDYVGQPPSTDHTDLNVVQSVVASQWGLPARRTLMPPWTAAACLVLAAPGWSPCRLNQLSRASRDVPAGYRPMPPHGVGCSSGRSWAETSSAQRSFRASTHGCC